MVVMRRWGGDGWQRLVTSVVMMATMMLAVVDGDGSGCEVDDCYYNSGTKWRCCEAGAAVDGEDDDGGVVKLTANSGWPEVAPEKMKEREWGLGFDNKMT
ncbi:hypothetical protein Tco_1143772 [Tanacetum coccineum]